MRTAIFTVAVMASILFAPAAPAAPDPASEQLLKSTADHSKFNALQQDFRCGPEVSKACLSCHTEAVEQKLNPSNRREST